MVFHYKIPRHFFLYSQTVCLKIKSFSQNSHLWAILKSHQHDSKLNKKSKFKPIMNNPYCRNPSFGLTTKAKGLQGCRPRGSLGITSETPGNARKCEGLSLHTPKATPALGDGVPVDSRNFRDRFEGSNLNGLWRFLYYWKAFGA
jgi:hypothetical protein